MTTKNIRYDVAECIKLLYETWTTPELKDDDTINVRAGEIGFIIVETSKPKLQNTDEFALREAGLLVDSVYLNKLGGVTVEYAIDMTDEDDQ